MHEGAKPLLGQKSTHCSNAIAQLPHFPQNTAALVSVLLTTFTEIISHPKAIGTESVEIALAHGFDDGSKPAKPRFAALAVRYWEIFFGFGCSGHPDVFWGLGLGGIFLPYHYKWTSITIAQQRANDTHQR